VNHIIIPALLSSSVDLHDQTAVDKFLIDLDGTPNKGISFLFFTRINRLGRLGANAILAVSMIICKFVAAEKGLELFEHLHSIVGGNNDNMCLPLPFLNVINGGAHAGNMLAFQEFMIIPTGATTFSQAMEIGSEVYQNLKSIIRSKHGVDGNSFQQLSKHFSYDLYNSYKRWR